MRLDEKRSVLAKGRIRALTGLKGRLQRIGLSTRMEKEKGVAGKGVMGYGFKLPPPS